MSVLVSSVVFVIDRAIHLFSKGAPQWDCDAAILIKAAFAQHRLHDTTAVPQANDHEAPGANGRIGFEIVRMRQRNNERKFRRDALLLRSGA